MIENMNSKVSDFLLRKNNFETNNEFDNCIMQPLE